MYDNKCTYAMAYLLSEKNISRFQKRNIVFLCLSLSINFPQRLFAFEKQNHYDQPFNFSYSSHNLLYQPKMLQ